MTSPIGTARGAWLAVAILTLCNALSILDRQIFSLLAEPIKASLAIGDLRIGLLQGPAFAILYASLGLPLGRLVDTTNRRWLVVFAVAAWSLCTAASGLASTFGMLLAARVGVGAGEAALAPAAYSIFADLFDRSKLGRASSIFATGGFVVSGAALAGGGSIYAFFAARGDLAAPLIGVVRPWQATFLAVGLPGLLVAAAVLILLKVPQRSATEEKPAVSAVVRYAWTERRFYLPVFAAYVAIGAAMSGFFNWVPAYLIRTYHVSTPAAAHWLGLILIATGLTAPFCAGWMTDRLALRNGPMAGVRVLRGLFAALAILSLIAFRAETLGVALVGVAAISLLTTGMVALVPIAIQAAAPPRMRGQLIAVALVFGNLIGVSLGPTSVAALSQFVFGIGGLRGALSCVVFSCAAVGFIASLVARGPIGPRIAGSAKPATSFNPVPAGRS